MVTVLLFWGTNMADVTSWEIAFYLSDFSRADWSRTVVNKSAGRGNDVMVALLFFSFLREPSTEIDVKNCQCYCK